MLNVMQQQQQRQQQQQQRTVTVMHHHRGGVTRSLLFENYCMSPGPANCNLPEEQSAKETTPSE